MKIQRHNEWTFLSNTLTSEGSDASDFKLDLSL